MDEIVSPKYQMQLIASVEQAIWDEYKSYKNVRLYINKWHNNNYDSRGYYDNFWENFSIVEKSNGEIDLTATLHNLKGSDLLRMAIDLGVDTPNFIPSIPTFKNELKSDYKTAYDTFTKAYKLIDTDPSTAIGLANSALESIIKEILKDERIASKIKGNETLYNLSVIILKEFNLTNNDNIQEIKTIGGSLISINQSIEKLRSQKTHFHGKTSEDFIINDPIFTHLVINSVATVGLFLDSYYKTKYPKPEIIVNDTENLPF